MLAGKPLSDQSTRGFSRRCNPDAERGGTGTGMSFKGSRTLSGGAGERCAGPTDDELTCREGLAGQPPHRCRRTGEEAGRRIGAFFNDKSKRIRVFLHFAPPAAYPYQGSFDIMRGSDDGHLNKRRTNLPLNPSFRLPILSVSRKRGLPVLGAALFGEKGPIQ